MFTEDPVLNDICEELKTQYYCHSIILYGSRARGDVQENSDYDVLGICSDGSKTRLARAINNSWLDVFIYSEKELQNPGEEHLYMSGGILLYDEKKFGQNFLDQLKKLQEGPPQNLTPDEQTARKVWYEKILSRSKRGDAEGHYRKINGLMAILEDFYLLQNERFQGPKESLRKLEIEYPTLFEFYQAALRDSNSQEKTELAITSMLSQVEVKVMPASLKFLPIDLIRHYKTAIAFRLDSYVVSFGNEERFWSEGGEKGEKYLEWLNDKIAFNDKSCVHIWLGQRIIGQLELGLFKKDPTTGYVNLYYLSPYMRGRGISKCLEEYVKDYFHKSAIQKAFLSVSPQNHRAISFY